MSTKNITERNPGADALIIDAGSSFPYQPLSRLTEEQHSTPYRKNYSHARQ